MSDKREFEIQVVQTFSVDSHIVDACIELNRYGSAIAAIKLIRASCSLGLREAKDINDKIKAGNPGRPIY